MTTNTKIYLGVAGTGIFAIGVIGVLIWSNHQIRKLENAVEAAREAALSSQQSAAKKEIEAAQYKQKAEYLEQNLIEIQRIARKQDEELEKLRVNTSRARGDAIYARRTRSITATAADLCAKLAEIGHGCD